MALPIWAVRVYGRFLNHVHDVSPHRRTYLGPPRALPPSCTVEAPERDATVLEHRQHVLKPWGVPRFDPLAPAQREPWMAPQARRGARPAALCPQAEPQVGAQRVLRPGPSGLARLIMHGWSHVHDERCATGCKRVSPALRQASAPLLLGPDGAPHAGLAHLKADPPAPSMAAIPASLQRSHTVAETGMAAGARPGLPPEWLPDLYPQAKRYHAKDLPRFTASKRSTLLGCCLLETRQTVLAHWGTLPDQSRLESTRHTHHAQAPTHREFRTRPQRAVAVRLAPTDVLRAWPDEPPLSKHALWPPVPAGA